MFILYITSRYSHFNILFSKPCQRQYELLPSLGVRRLSSVYFSHRSVSKHGHHMQFLFLIGRFLKSLLLWNCLAIWTLVGSIYMYGSSVLSFLKAEWKVSDTGSVHWASSYSSKIFSQPQIQLKYIQQLYKDNISVEFENLNFS